MAHEKMSRINCNDAKFFQARRRRRINTDEKHASVIPGCKLDKGRFLLLASVAVEPIGLAAVELDDYVQGRILLQLFLHLRPAEVLHRGCIAGQREESGTEKQKRTNQFFHNGSLIRMWKNPQHSWLLANLEMAAGVKVGSCS